MTSFFNPPTSTHLTDNTKLSKVYYKQFKLYFYFTIAKVIISKILIEKTAFKIVCIRCGLILVIWNIICIIILFVIRQKHRGQYLKGSFCGLKPPVHCRSSHTSKILPKGARKYDAEDVKILVHAISNNMLN